MKPNELKKATSVRLDTLLGAISILDRAMYLIPGISWNDRRTLELWREQVTKAQQLKDGKL